MEPALAAAATATELVLIEGTEAALELPVVL